MSDYQAGRELDALIAEKVMGWTPVYLGPDGVLGPRVLQGSLDDLDYYRTGREHAPSGWSPSTDIGAAWTVVEKMRADERFGALDSLGFQGQEWRCVFYTYAVEGEGFPARFFHGCAPTAPLAICRAALASLKALDRETT